MNRRWIFWLFVIAFVWVVASRFTEVERLFETLVSGQWHWIFLAALFQVIYYIVYAGLYQSSFECVDVHSRIAELLPVTFAALFVNVAAPFAGASGAALFVDDAARRGQSAARTTVGMLVVQVVYLSTFLLLLFAGLAYLFVQHDLEIYEIIGALILLVLTGGFGGLLLLSLWKPNHMYHLIIRVQRTADRLADWLKRPRFLDRDWAERHSAEFSEAAAAIAARPRRLWRPFFIALAVHLIDLICLYCLFLAFHQSASLGILVAGYAMGILFWIVSITPQGIGVVEGMMTLVFSSLGVPGDAAAIIALSFRGLTFWLPLATGFFLLRHIWTFKGERQPSPDTTGLRIVAVLTALMGFIILFSAVTPSFADPLRTLEQYSPLAGTHTGNLASIMAGLALLLLSVNLWRRRKYAWILAEIILVISVFLYLYRGLDYKMAAFSAVLAGWLLYNNVAASKT
jgi:uncharacterized protein (TIRG00374 family)